MLGTERQTKSRRRSRLHSNCECSLVSLCVLSPIPSIHLDASRCLAGSGVTVAAASQAFRSAPPSNWKSFSSWGLERLLMQAPSHKVRM